MSDAPKKSGLSPFAIPILIILTGAAIAMAASMMYAQKEGIEWTFGMFLRIAFPTLLILWGLSMIGKNKAAAHPPAEKKEDKKKDAKKEEESH